jgi:CD2 antigen cytoplasmic tail-binding protein 2
VRFPKGKKAKHRDPSAAGGSGDAGAAEEDIDSLMNPELAAVKRARRRHRREGDDAQGTANVKGFEMRYKVCGAASAFDNYVSYASDCSHVASDF